jgi:hypothetical protein
MNRRFMCQLIVIFCAVVLAICEKSNAGPQLPAQTIYVPHAPLVILAGEGCGWDYACPPVPDFGKPFAPASSGVYIRNNYGTVNVGRGTRRRGAEDRFVERSDCEDARDNGGVCVERQECGGYACDERCGPLCWMRRFKRGYCGHGCEAYLKQRLMEDEARAEREREEAEAARLEDRRPPGCSGPRCWERRADKPAWREGGKRWPERERFEPEPPLREAPLDLTPRERFEGPAYRGTCTGASC